MALSLGFLGFHHIVNLICENAHTHTHAQRCRLNERSRFKSRSDESEASIRPTVNTREATQSETGTMTLSSKSPPKLQRDS